MSEQLNAPQRPGCSTTLLFMGIAAIAGGSYLMSRWEALPGGGKAGAVVLIVLGTIWVVPFFLLLAARIFIKRALGKLTRDLTDAGQRIIEDNKALYGQIHQYRAATAADFSALDRDFYEAAGNELATLGYRYLGDIVNQSIAELKGITPVIRVMTSADGTTVAGIYHFSPARLPSRLRDRKLLICDLATEFSDGTFLMSGNTQEVNTMTSPPRIQSRRHPMTTPIPQLVQLHESERQKLLAADPALTCTSVNTLADAMEFEKRQQQIRNDFRKEIGFIEPDEVRRAARNTNASPETTESLAQAVEVARRREQQRGSE